MNGSKDSDGKSGVALFNPKTKGYIELSIG